MNYALRKNIKVTGIVAVVVVVIVASQLATTDSMALSTDMQLPFGLVLRKKLYYWRFQADYL